jgi:hypothetical protein
MGIYIRKDSPYYWLVLPREGARCLREKTKILVDGGTSLGSARNRQLADSQYRLRMQQLAEGQEIPSRPATTGVQSLVYVYFVGDGELVKIGRTINMEGRLAALQTSHHRKLELLALAVGDPKSETTLHRRFSAGRTRGEWFRRDTPGLMELIDVIKDHPGMPLMMATITAETRKAEAQSASA